MDTATNILKQTISKSNLTLYLKKNTSRPSGAYSRKAALVQQLENQYNWPYKKRQKTDHFVCKYFLPFWGLTFHFGYGFLYCAKAFTLIRSHLLIFAFIFITQGCRLRKILLWFASRSVLLTFSSNSFIVSGLIHLGL